MNDKVMPLSLLVSSCDAFSDCWKPFLRSMSSFWPDCPYQVFIISNGKTVDADNPNVHFIDVGHDMKWGTNLRAALTHIDTEWILYLQEDYFFDRSVGTSVIEDHIRYCRENNVDCLRLTFPFFKSEPAGDGYFKSPFSRRYGVCLQAAIWNRQSLFDCIVDGWTGWDFEYGVSSILEDRNSGFNSIVVDEAGWPGNGVCYVEGTAVRKGRWTRAGLHFLVENGFGELAGTRAVEGPVLSYLQRPDTMLPDIIRRVCARIMNEFRWNF